MNDQDFIEEGASLKAILENNSFEIFIVFYTQIGQISDVLGRKRRRGQYIFVLQNLLINQKFIQQA